MKKQSSLLLLLMLICLLGKAQDFKLYQKMWMVQGGDSLPYRVLLPKDYDASKTYPLIFFLHGAGERGSDNGKQLVHGGNLFLRDSIRNNYKAIVVFPQCSRDDYWANVLRVNNDSGKRTFIFLEDGAPGKYMQMLQELLTYVLSAYPVNKKQVYVGGLSMGGMGTYELVRRMPGTFAAAFAICGGANPATAVKMKSVKWWIFHGAKDDVVLPHYSQDMAIALKKAGASVQFTLYPNDNHNSWDSAFAEPGLLAWLFSQHQ